MDKYMKTKSELVEFLSNPEVVRSLEKGNPGLDIKELIRVWIENAPV
jgi:hypothetical protein